MSESLKEESSDKLSQLIIEGMQELKALDITLIDLKTVNSSVADYFVVCTGSSDTHVDAIANSVEGIIKKKTSEFPKHIEGKQNGEWILLDYVDVVAHVFKEEKRSFYNLEDLWGDARVIKIDNVESEQRI